MWPVFSARSNIIYTHSLHFLLLRFKAVNWYLTVNLWQTWAALFKNVNSSRKNAVLKAWSMLSLNRVRIEWTDLDPPRQTTRSPGLLQEDVHWEREDVAHEGNGLENAERQRSAEAIHIPAKKKNWFSISIHNYYYYVNNHLQLYSKALPLHKRIISSYTIHNTINIYSILYTWIIQ